ncbi:helix-turn-helix domain-containing protein [Yoonia sp. R2331]|uniref:helix-turn-helix transcriptional regulator n=1 Tax=Yoonia sp. R2331 TaxID=3237238 RepID=UPI0034E41B22
MTHLTLSYRDILQDGAMAHVTRATLTSQRPRPLHEHDFFEVFWVQNGTVRHHLPGRVETLQEGDMICLSPGQSHGLQGKGEAAMVALICLHPDVVGGLITQFPALTDAAFRADAPTRFHRDMRALTSLNQAAIALEHSALDAMSTTAFLLPLLSSLVADTTTLPPDAPVWLAHACRVARDPAVFRNGSAGLVALTGKAHPHVSRTMRRHLGMTPSDYINTLRMDQAARALVTDTEPLADIAESCGIPNLSHFHKLFRARFGLTPLKYRQRYQRDVIQP